MYEKPKPTNFLHDMDWFDGIVKQYHPTKEVMLDFLYKMDWPHSVQFDVIEFIEKNKGTPLELYHQFPKVWWKILYAISLVIETKSSGKIAYYNPNGFYQLVPGRFNSMSDTWEDEKLEITMPPTPIILLNYVKGTYIPK